MALIEAACSGLLGGMDDRCIIYPAVEVRRLAISLITLAPTSHDCVCPGGGSGSGGGRASGGATRIVGVTQTSLRFLFLSYMPTCASGQGFVSLKISWVTVGRYLYILLAAFGSRFVTFHYLSPAYHSLLRLSLERSIYFNSPLAIDLGHS